MWDTNIRPLLLKRFADATPEQTKEAHGYSIRLMEWLLLLEHFVDLSDLLFNFAGFSGLSSTRTRTRFRSLQFQKSVKKGTIAL